jgi:type II secretory pathway pseudopilin PulG
VKLFSAPRRKSKPGGQPAARHQKARRQKTRGQEDGYILLTLLLVVALMGIFALAASQLMKIQFEIQRDQEQEMIHRGVQYSRAIRGYYKKFGRYPTKLEDLDNTNNLRYLRKHYKDPLNKNKDFKLLHFGEQGVTLAGGIGGATPAGSPAGLNGLNPSSQSNSAFGSPGGTSAFGNSGVNQSGVFAQSSGLGSSSNSALGANSNSQATTNQTGTSGSTTTPGSDPTQASTPVAAGTAQVDTSSSSQQLVASGPIVGVASLVKKDTIRLFNKKKQYNEWQFVYDPTFDRGGLITTPYQPSLLTAATNNLQPNSTNGSSSQSPFGQSTSGQSSFGQSTSGQSGQSSFGNNSGTTSPTPPAQPSTTSSPQ